MSPNHHHLLLKGVVHRRRYRLGHFATRPLYIGELIFSQDNVNLRQSVKQLEQAVGELQAENARMREFILCVHKSIANSSFGKGVTPPVTEEQLALPFSFVSDNLQTWLTQCVARSNQVIRISQSGSLLVVVKNRF